MTTEPGMPRGSEPGSGQAGRKVCAGCGAVNEPTSDFCYRCGLRLPAEVATGDTVGNPAGFWIRFGAWLIDQILLGVVGTIILVAFWDPPTGDSLLEAFTLSSREWLITFLFEAAYWTFTIGRWGKSIGKALLQVKVVRVDGGKVSYPLAFARYLASLLSWMMFGIGHLIIVFHPQKRALHDLICDTRVIRS
jgi:uncharacterized RDD family membrane protein YckC